jgi:hypothetical protein
LLFALLSPACAQFETARECSALVGALTDWRSEQAEKRPGAPARGTQAAVTESRVLAQRYDGLSSKISGLGVSSAALAPKADAYAKLAREASRALRDVADAVERGDAETARRRRVEFDDLARGEAGLVASINQLCR